MDENSFRRILKPKHASISASRLNIAYWLSHTYLVEEYSDAYDNYCKKIELSKIQAFTCVMTLRNKIIAICLSGLIAFMIFWMVTSSNWGVGLYVAMGFTFALVVGVAVKLSEGSSCEVYVHTAVGSRELEGIKNVKRATKFLKEVDDVIRRLQGEVDVDSVNANIEEAENIISRVAVLNKIKNSKKVAKEAE